MKFDKLKPDLQNLNLAGVKKAASRAARVRVKLSRRQGIAIACAAIVAGLLLALLLRPRPAAEQRLSRICGIRCSAPNTAATPNICVPTSA